MYFGSNWVLKHALTTLRKMRRTFKKGKHSKAQSACKMSKFNKGVWHAFSHCVTFYVAFLGSRYSSGGDNILITWSSGSPLILVTGACITFPYFFVSFGSAQASYQAQNFSEIFLKVLFLPSWYRFGWAMSHQQQGCDDSWAILPKRLPTTFDAILVGSISYVSIQSRRLLFNSLAFLKQSIESWFFRHLDLLLREQHFIISWSYTRNIFIVHVGIFYDTQTNLEELTSSV